MQTKEEMRNSIGATVKDTYMTYTEWIKFNQTIECIKWFIIICLVVLFMCLIVKTIREK